jgi:hypothetical protein
MDLTYKQALLAAYTILDDLHDKTKSTPLFHLLGDMNPFVFTDHTPADPATWSEWIACAKEIQNEGILSDINAFKALVSFLYFNEGQYGYKTSNILNDIESQPFQKRWQQLIVKASTLKDESTF